MKGKKYLISPLHFMVSFFTAFALIILVFIFIAMHNYVAFIACLVLAILFIHEAFVYGRVVEINSYGVKMKHFNCVEKDWRWDEITQVGVAGTRVFMKDFLGKTGSLFIYLSKEELDEQQIFNMMLDWPPKDKVFIKYDIDRLNMIQTYYSGRIKVYNAGDIKIYGKET